MGRRGLMVTVMGRETGWLSPVTVEKGEWTGKGNRSREK